MKFPFVLRSTLDQKISEYKIKLHEKDLDLNHLKSEITSNNFDISDKDSRISFLEGRIQNLENTIKNKEYVIKTSESKFSIQLKKYNHTTEELEKIIDDQQSRLNGLQCMLDTTDQKLNSMYAKGHFLRDKKDMARSLFSLLRSSGIFSNLPAQLHKAPVDARKFIYNYLDTILYGFNHKKHK